jgi:hypothetical protein
MLRRLWILLCAVIIFPSSVPNLLPAQERQKERDAFRERDRIALQNKIHPRVRELLSEGKTVRVIVTLAATQTEKVRNPSREDDERKRAAIAELRNGVLNNLTKSTYRITHTYDYIPAIALEIFSSVALNELEQSPFVTRVREDGPGTF